MGSPVSVAPNFGGCFLWVWLKRLLTLVYIGFSLPVHWWMDCTDPVGFTSGLGR